MRMTTSLRCRALAAKALSTDMLGKNAIYNDPRNALTDHFPRRPDLMSCIAEMVRLKEEDG